MASVLCGCWGTKSAAPPATAPVATRSNTSTSGIRFVSRVTNPCVRVVTRVFEHYKDDFKTNARFTQAMFDDMRDVAVASCQESGWSTEVLGCYDNAQTSDESTACYSMMPQEQQKQFTDRLMEVMQRHTSAGSAAPTP